MHFISFPRWPFSLCVYSIKEGHIVGFRAHLINLEDLEEQRKLRKVGGD